MTAKPSIEEIQRKVAEYHEVPFEVLMSKNRSQLVSYARHIAMFLTKEAFPYLSSKNIGDRFNREGTAAWYAINEATGRIQTSKEFAARVDACRELIKNNGCVKSGQ